jgi:hypothetical protein
MIVIFYKFIIQYFLLTPSILLFWKCIYLKGNCAALRVLYLGPPLAST